MSGNVCERNVAVVAHPSVPVPAAEAGCFDFDDDAVHGRRGGWDIFYGKFTAEFGEVDCLHERRLRLGCCNKNLNGCDEESNT